MEMRDAFFKSLHERMQWDKSAIVLTGDQGAFWLDKIREDMQAQYLNCGIAEQNMIGVAAGLALSGRKVFVHGINNFIVLRALEQIAVDIVQHRADVTLIGCGAGYTYSTDGPTHHGVSDFAVALSVGMPVWNASDPYNSAWMAENVKGPAYIRIEKGDLPYLSPVKKYGRDMNLRRAGSPLWIASGYMVHEALKREGGVLDIQSFPINVNRLRTYLGPVREMRVLEDNNHGPIAQAVAKIIMEDLPGGVFESFAPQFNLHEYGSRAFLHRKAGI